MRARGAVAGMEPDSCCWTNRRSPRSARVLWLQNYLKNFPARCPYSHDRQFMDEVVSQVHEISEKKLIAYTGNYTDTCGNGKSVTTSNSPRTRTAEGNASLRSSSRGFVR